MHLFPTSHPASLPHIPFTDTESRDTDDITGANGPSSIYISRLGVD